jgi:hypothetical protein
VSSAAGFKASVAKTTPKRVFATCRLRLHYQPLTFTVIYMDLLDLFIYLLDSLVHSTA